MWCVQGKVLIQAWLKKEGYFAFLLTKGLTRACLFCPHHWLARLPRSWKKPPGQEAALICTGATDVSSQPLGFCSLSTAVLQRVTPGKGINLLLTFPGMSRKSLFWSPVPKAGPLVIAFLHGVMHHTLSWRVCYRLLWDIMRGEFRWWKGSLKCQQNLASCPSLTLGKCPLNSFGRKSCVRLHPLSGWLGQSISRWGQTRGAGDPGRAMDEESWL